MPRQATDIELCNTVLFKSRIYATLDFQPPGLDRSVPGTGNARAELPEGWELAPDEPEIVLEVIAKHGWGSAAIVLSSFIGYSTRWNSPAGAVNGQGLNEFRPQNNMYCIETGNTRRLLIRTDRKNLKGVSSQGYCAEILAGLGKRRKFTDCTIGCGDQVIACHRSVLAEASPVFERMLESEMVEGASSHIKLADAKPEVVQAMVDFIYTGIINIDKGDIADLVSLADCYELVALLLASAEQALEVVDVSNIGKLARSFRPLAGTPQGEKVFKAFLDLLKSNDELLKAVIVTM